jgi:hypothetical protein
MCLSIKPQLIKSSTVHRGSSTKLSSYSDATMTLTVPTFVEKQAKQMDTEGLTLSDLDLLKKNDTFMYYSIASVRNAEMHCKDVDQSVLSSNAGACKSQKVTRKQRVSTECHPMLLLEEMFTDTKTVSADDALDEYIASLLE